MIRSAAALLAVFLSSAVFAQATTRPTESPDQTAARAALVAFLKTVETGDAATLKALCDRPETARAYANLIPADRASRAFYAAAGKKFGDTAAKLEVPVRTAAQLLARMKDLEITVTGDSAVSQPDTFLLVRIDGQWKFAGSKVDPEHKVIEPLLSGSVLIITETTREIEADKYKSVEDLKAALDKKFETFLTELLTKAWGTSTTTAPATP
jgi:hypothetical protein